MIGMTAQVGDGRARHLLDGERVVCETHCQKGVSLYTYQGKIQTVTHTGLGEVTCGHCVNSVAA